MKALRPWLWGVLAALVSPLAASGQATLSALSVAVDGNRALVSFHLDDAFDPRFVERVQSGLPTGFTYQLELLKDRKRWYDRALEDTTFQVVAMYDALSREYLVNYKLGGKLVESRMVTDLADLEPALTRIEDLPAFDLGNVPRSWRLLVRVRAELGPRTILSFIPAKDSTEWIESNKFRSFNDLPDQP
jgi:Domain of unknown function (DUF4390)